MAVQADWLERDLYTVLGGAGLLLKGDVFLGFCFSVASFEKVGDGPVNLSVFASRRRTRLSHPPDYKRLAEGSPEALVTALEPQNANE